MISAVKPINIGDIVYCTDRDAFYMYETYPRHWAKTYLPDPSTMVVPRLTWDEMDKYVTWQQVESETVEADKPFHRIANEIASLVTEKNLAYGDSFSQSGDILRILFPDGVKVEQYRDFLAITRTLDKLFRIATHKGAYGEEAWLDLCGYALLSVAADRQRKLI